MTTAFEIESFHNMHLPRGGTMVDVVVTVTAGGQGHVSSHSQERSEILIVDTSGSMADGEKIRSASPRRWPPSTASPTASASD